VPQFVMPRTTPPEFRIRVPVVFAILECVSCLVRGGFRELLGVCAIDVRVCW